MKYRAAIFDMDGTILNTQEDLRDAMNYAMEKTGHRHDYTWKDAGLVFGSGVHVAVTRTLALEQGMEREEVLKLGTPEGRLPAGVSEEEVQRVLRIYKPYYETHCAILTRPYPGVEDMLRQMRRQGVMTAVVSNKPDEAVQTLAQRHFNGLFDLALGQRDDVRRKPYPDMTIATLKALHCTSGDAVYIGDTEIDLLTAQNAQMDCIAVNWGFRSETYLRSCGAETIVSCTDELCRKILGN